MELAENVADAVVPGLDHEHVIVLDFESQIYSLDLGSLKAVYLECFVVLVCFVVAFEGLRNAIMKLNLNILILEIVSQQSGGVVTVSKYFFTLIIILLSLLSYYNSNCLVVSARQFFESVAFLITSSIRQILIPKFFPWLIGGQPNVEVLKLLLVSHF